MATTLEQLSAALADRYRIERELGAGGMATVYLAFDVRHDRRVALKVLRPELAAVIGAERFLVEIKTTANLQHPHILPLFDSGQVNGTVFYVMPYVQGESLRDRLTREKQLPVEDALRLTKEVANALDYAHRHGVIHRDIKPENILLHDGSALVADFGIALAANSASGGRMTETGMSLGTPHYMSPEQAMGERQLDARADVYALGCVLYEMLVGEPPFTGPTAQSIVAKVITEKPPSATTIRESVPRHVAGAIQMALAKLPADRFAGAAAFADALSRPGTYASLEAAAMVEHATAASAAAAHRPTRQPAVFAALALTTALALWGWLRPKPSETPTATARFEFSPPRERAVRSETGRNVAISPDGSRVVYVGAAPSASTMLYMRRLGDVDLSPVPGTEGGSQPFFSPDGSWIGFYTTAAIKKVPVAGGPALTITRLTALIRGPRWGADGNILYSDYRNRLMRVSAAGGTATALQVADTTARYRWPELLPDGKAVLLSTPEHQVGILELETGKVTTLLPEGDGPIYLASGFLLYGHQSQSLLAVPFDLKRRTVTGSPVPVLQGVQVFSGGAVQLGLSSGGVAAYLAGASAQGQLRLVDSTGAETPLPPKGASMALGRFSPNGKRLAYHIAAQAGGASDIYILDIARGTSTRLSSQSDASSPIWSPDGEFVAYSGPGPMGPDLYQRRADGSEPEQLLASFPGDQDIADFAPDGRLVVMNYSDITNIDIVTPGAKAAAEPYLHEAWHNYMASLSPDGQWLAYASRETGNDEVYVRAYPTAKGKWQISQGGGTAPRWASDGRTLYYIRDDSLLATTVRSGTSFEVGARRWAVRWPYEQAFATTYDVSPDGKRFAVVSFPDVGAVTVATNWFTELRERLAGAATSGGNGSRP